MNADLGAAVGTVNRMVNGFVAMLPLFAVALVAFIVLLFVAKTDGDRTRQREGWRAGENPPKPLRSSPGSAGETSGG